jgi:hypothetical protein
LGAALGFILLTTLHWAAAMQWVNAPLRTTTPEQPLVTMVPNLFDGATFGQLQACASQHPLLGPSTLGKAFTGTHTFVVYFDTRGLANELRNDPRLRCLLPFVDRVVGLDQASGEVAANAWVLNVLVVEPAEPLLTPPETTTGGTTTASRPALAAAPVPVRWHVDQSARLWGWPRFTAHAVSVWYAALPYSDVKEPVGPQDGNCTSSNPSRSPSSGMRGGELELALFSDKWWRKHALASLRAHHDGGCEDLQAVSDAQTWADDFRPRESSSTSTSTRGGTSNTGNGDGNDGNDDDDDDDGTGSDGVISGGSSIGGSGGSSGVSHVWERGALQCLDPQTGLDRTDALAVDPHRRLARVAPSENLLVTFRGDAFHRVLPYAATSTTGSGPSASAPQATGDDTTTRKAATAGEGAVYGALGPALATQPPPPLPPRRVSLVLEQYRIPAGHQWRTRSFLVKSAAVTPCQARGWPWVWKR